MRGKQSKQRVIAADPRYGSVLAAKFINFLMERGKKTTAQTIFYQAMDKIVADTKKDAMKVFEEAINLIRPQVEVRSRRVGGANYQVPLPVRGERQDALAFRWIIEAARNKKGQPMFERLATILVEASQNTGDAIRKRDDVHRMAEANKAFAHFARFGNKRK